MSTTQAQLIIGKQSPSKKTRKSDIHVYFRNDDDNEIINPFTGKILKKDGTSHQKLIQINALDEAGNYLFDAKDDEVVKTLREKYLNKEKKLILKENEIIHPLKKNKKLNVNSKEFKNLVEKEIIDHEGNIITNTKKLLIEQTEKNLNKHYKKFIRHASEILIENSDIDKNYNILLGELAKLYINKHLEFKGTMPP
ncbi:hypothetical protein HDV06_006555 [Boothiomyces sp. JEL0866]|nr:hypothetical protein HDV06_006555 [Boothiomyces sp. JEL0866]